MSFDPFAGLDPDDPKFSAGYEDSDEGIDSLDGSRYDEPVESGREHAGTTEGDRELNKILKKAGIKTERKPRRQVERVIVEKQTPLLPIEIDYAELCMRFDQFIDKLTNVQEKTTATHSKMIEACNKSNVREVCSAADAFRSNARMLGGVRENAERTRSFYCPLRKPSQNVQFEQRF